MTVIHSHEDRKSIINRLSRLAGHVESIKGMVEGGRTCTDVLIQLQAVRAAVNSLSRVVLTEHISHCVVDAIKAGDPRVLEDLNAAIAKVLK